jgi:hypothetical protein
MFFSVPDNPKLKELPATILEMPELLFINTNNTNLKLPEGFENEFAETEGAGTGYWSKVG